jgi:hypothetical protein
MCESQSKDNETVFVEILEVAQQATVLSHTLRTPADVNSGFESR